MRMITEAGYIELMKNCSKWNSRFRNESKRRLPYFDQQTATSHRSSPARRKSMKNRCPSDDPNYIVRYESMRWKKKNSSAPADTTELKFFAQQNPALAEALNAQAQSTQNTALVEQLQTENSVDSFSTPETRRGIQAKYEEFERDDDDTPSDAGSDGDDWGSKRKRRKGGPVKKKAGIKEMVAPKKETRRSAPAPAPAAPPVAAPSPPPRGHPCDSCSAKYKSRAGLIHHRAFWHNQFPNPNSPHPSRSISPSVDVSNFCDLCLGNRFKNRDGEAEDLVTCHDCGRSGHPSCLKFTPNMTFSTAKFGWQCIECKSCAICGTSENDDKLLFCDDCDRGFHIYCLNPPLKSAPENEWSCHMCQSQFGEKASAPTKP